MKALPPSTASLVRSVAAVVCKEDAGAFRMMRLHDALAHAERRCHFLLTPHGDYGRVPARLMEAAIHEAVLATMASALLDSIDAM